MEIQLEQIQGMIYLVRGLRVMLDSDLANLYGVETKVLNQAVRRNLKRFPEDFMFMCDFDELEDLRSQIVTANPTSTWNYKRRNSPMVFTENGVAMLSSVLKSDAAININIKIMRVFTKLRSYLAFEQRLERKVDKLDQNTTRVFKVVFSRLDNLEEIFETPKRRRKIGFQKD